MSHKNIIKSNSLMSFTRTLWEGLIGLFYPPVCIACQQGADTGNLLCSQCALQIKALAISDACPRCSSEAPQLRYTEKAECPHCSGLSKAFCNTAAIGRYDGILRDLILKLKYNSMENYSYPLAELMCEKMDELGWAKETDFIVSVPLHISRQKKRTFNQAELLAEKIASRYRIPHADDILIRNLPTSPQVTLSQRQRLLNLKNAFALKDSEKAARLLQGKKLLLVDDVMTTGATISECARILDKIKPEVIRVLVAARTTSGIPTEKTAES